MIVFDDSCDFTGTDCETVANDILALKASAPVIKIENRNITLNATAVNCFKGATGRDYYEVLRKSLSEFSSLDELLRVYCDIYHEEIPTEERVYNIAISGAINMLMEELFMILQKGNIPDGHYVESIRAYLATTKGLFED